MATFERPTVPATGARLSFILGGARSGKSAYALKLASEAGLTNVFIATAQAFDDEMAERIAAHQAERDGDWRTVEAPVHASAAVMTEASPDRIVVLDCLTLWLSNVVLAERDVAQDTRMLIDALTAAKGPVICVSNEVGLGVVPENALARRFRDAQGRLNQAVAAIADHVVFLAAGLPLTLKQPGASS